MIKKLLDTYAPKNYNLSLSVDPDGLKFSGTVTITGELVSETKTLQLHAKQLNITSISINNLEAKHKIEPKYDILSLETDSLLNKGALEIAIEFNGVITEDMVGMYPCYFEHEGKTKKIIATQFESHHAREVFPCIDEPAAKATFELTLQTPAGNPVISNMTEREQNEKDGTLTTVFDVTPRMSTYLLAFVTGPMQFKEAVTAGGVKVRSWSSLAQPIDAVDHSLTEAVALIEFYNDYFDIPYPLTKCDQVALPDFDSGAMENWGLVTYRETAMLTDPGNRSISNEQYVSLVIAHELSHQWFGNLVTMNWWDDLWLNESFASLMEYIAVDALHPEWQYWEEYTSTDAVAASNRDVYSDVQPVRVDVDDPAQIATLFDGAIVYAKGGRLLKMLREYIGETAFRSGLKQYFIKFQYQNTTRDDLWNAFSASSGKNIGELMNSWLEQSGLPIVSISQNEDQLTLSQERLLLDTTENKPQTWQIPLLSQTKLTPDIFKTGEATVQSNSDEIVLLNQQASGHYVVQYNSEKQLLLLRDGLKSLQVDPAGRINTLNDMILLAKAGKNSLTDALTVTKTLSNEPRDSVWGMIGAIIGSAKMISEGDTAIEKLIKDYTYNLVQPLYESFGWEFSDEDDPNTTHLRRTILGLAVSSENLSVINKALSLYDTDNPADIDAEVRGLLMSVAVRFGDKSVIDELLNLYVKTASPEIKADVSGALASTKDPQVAERLVALFKDKNTIRPQDLIRWYVLILRNQHTRDVAWGWLKENWDWVKETFASSKSYDAFPRYSAGAFNTDQQLKDYKDFFESKQSDLALERNIKVGIKEITARVAWRERDQALVKQWLEDNK